MKRTILVLFLLQIFNIFCYVTPTPVFRLQSASDEYSTVWIHGKEYSLEEKMEELIERLKQHGHLDFCEYFNSQESIEEALISFFCLLELIKARIVIAVQESLFHPIQVWPKQGARQ